MSMRIYFDPDKIQKSKLFQDRTSGEKPLKPGAERWRHCFLGGFQMGWDGNRGEPFIEVSGYKTLNPPVYPLPSDLKEICCDAERCISFFIIKDSWVGHQPSACLRNLVTIDPQTQRRTDSSVALSAVVEQSGSRVIVEVCCIMNIAVILNAYWLIRTHGCLGYQDTGLKFEEVQLLDCPPSDDET